jgi:hypothetical protein
MAGSLFVMTRQVEGDAGESFKQTVTVYARDQKSAKALVWREFDRIRRASGSDERPYLRTPEWTSVQKFTLDEDKLIMQGITI